MNKAEIKQLLHQGVITVTFTKVNGDERVMTCTLQSDYIPAPVVTEGAEKKAPRPEPEDLVRVYDLNAKGWRSFKVDSVKNIDF